MRTFKILTLVLAIMMLGTAIMSCGSEKVSATVKVSATAGEDIVLNEVEITVEGTAENPPSVLQAVKEALIQYEISYVDDEKSILDIGDYKETSDGTNEYFWEYTVNDVAPKQGRAVDNLISDRDVIKFVYTSVPIEGAEDSESTEDTTAESVAE